jgi:hypothetical protein
MSQPWHLPGPLAWIGAISLLATSLHAQEAWKRDHDAGAKAAKAAHFAEAETLLSKSADEVSSEKI